MIESSQNLPARPGDAQPLGSFGASSLPAPVDLSSPANALAEPAPG
jgi:hypothetical protein